ncbi:MAG TPA: hypothetical protein VIR79_02590, partial [Nitrospira sp.]
ATRPISPMKPSKKPSGGRPLLWVLLLALVGGIGYIALEPEQVMDWLAPFIGETAPVEQPPIAMRPKPTAPPPTTSAGQPAPDLSTPAPTAPAASAPIPSAPAPTMAPLAPAANPVSSPMFGEGQNVTVIGNPAIPSEMISLTMDPAGAKPGPSVRAGVTLTVLDGSLQPNGWVYSVKTEDGAKGWIGEKRLRLKF